MNGIDIDYSLVWNMQHGNNEGTSTGTFIDWVNKPGGLADMVITFLGVSRLGAGARNVMAKEMKPTLKSIQDTLNRRLSARQKEEVKFKVPVLIELLSRLDSLFKLKFDIEFISKE